MAKAAKATKVANIQKTKIHQPKDKERQTEQEWMDDTVDPCPLLDKTQTLLCMSCRLVMLACTTYILRLSLCVVDCGGGALFGVVSVLLGEDVC